MARSNASLRCSDGVRRCWWATADPLYVAYHDERVCFLGPTTMYAFMQAMGLVNDHLVGCVSRVAGTRARLDFRRPEAPR